MAPNSVPVSRLPTELLVKIFSHTLSSGIRMTLSMSFKSPIGSPWTLALVCRRWKSIVFFTSALWTSLAVDFVAAPHVCAQRGIDSEDVVRLTDALIRTLHVALLRSQNQPLRIAIVSDSDATAIQFVPEAMLLFVRHSKRWKSAVFEFWCDLLDQRYSNLLEVLGRDDEGNKRSFPLLEQILLKGPGALAPPMSISQNSWLRLFQDAPLSSVWFKGDPHLFPELGQILNWSNITEFSTEMSSIQLFHRCNIILRGMPKLTVFKLTVDSYPYHPIFSGGEMSLHNLELPELRDFWICPDQGSPLDLSIVFKTFPRAPNLSRLGIQPEKSITITDTFLPEFANFIARSRCTITYLHIDNLPAHQTLALFQLLPHVELLVAEGIHFDEGLIVGLTVPPDGSHLRPGVAPVLLPRLRRVGITGIVRPGLENYFFGIFESRRLYPAVEGGQTLEAAHVELSFLQSS